MSISGYCEDENGTDLGGNDWNLPVAFSKRRHLSALAKIDSNSKKTSDSENWRLKERMKTVSVALVLCLNVGVDPPDIVKTQPCSRLECWIDPLATSSQKALEAIGASLQKQYERWQPRARYKLSLDPTVEEVKKLCTSLRRNAKEERVLFHYNGHGVPKPTMNGEIWVFNKSYTQYIPLSIYDLQTWMVSPSIYVYDCSNAGVIIELFKQFSKQREQDFELAACGATQILPMNPELPADLFTSCLTSPIKVALHWFVMQNTAKLVPNVTLELIDKIPGQLSDRRTMMGELNWIFTAVTDTIAWNTLPRDLFQKLFRQDLLVASLFRNFLLAERVMRSYNCSPVSNPKLPPTYQHPIWQAWDLALDIILAQLPMLMERENYTFQLSPFFAEQLTAFQVWLTFGSEIRNPPEQLPIVLQVLLSQVHRLRALDLLGRFLDLGPWAVNLALSVGIYPYILKLLQSSARELRPLLVFIWAKILAVDKTCQSDLVRDNCHKYFLGVLEDIRMPSEHRTMAAFSLSCLLHGYPIGQEAALQDNLIAICLEQLGDPNHKLRQWLAICLGQTWSNLEDARWCGVRDSAHEKLFVLLEDPHPEVRAAAVYALGTFISCVSERTEHADTINYTVCVTLLSTVGQDGSPLVRKELVVALHWLVMLCENQFVVVAFQQMEEEKVKDGGVQSPQGGTPSKVFGMSHDVYATLNMRKISHKEKNRVVGAAAAQLHSSNGSLESVASNDHHRSASIDKMKRAASSSSIIAAAVTSCNFISVPNSSIYVKIWQGFQLLARDPHPEVKGMAQKVASYIKRKAKLLQSHEASTPKTATATCVSAPSSPANKSPYFSGAVSPVSQEMPRSTTLPGRLPFQQCALSSQFTRTRKLFDKGPSVIQEDGSEPNHQRCPLVETDFVDRCAQYFIEPVMKFSEDLDPESQISQKREWRFLRNAKCRRKVEGEQRKSAVSLLEEQIFINKNPNVPLLIKFHPYEPHMAVADKDCITIWNLEHYGRCSHFNNAHPTTSRISSVEYINAHNEETLCLGTDDGAIRIWGPCTPEEKDPELITSWQASPELLHANRGNGMVIDWEQESCHLITAGDPKLIRVWDCEREKCVKEIQTNADSYVTSIAVHENLIAAGFGNGTVRLFDRRVPQNESCLMTLREHSAWVVATSICKWGSSAGEFLTGSVGGDIKVWDRRMHSSLRTFHAAQSVVAMCVHAEAGLIACGSANQYVSIYNWQGEYQNAIKYHDGFMGQRISSVTALGFHPLKVNLGTGCADMMISVYTWGKKKDT